MGFRHLWRRFSVAKKLYTVIGVMALLITLEIGTLLFAMSTLSSVRNFVGGESFWSKAQKDAVLSLHKYARTKNDRYYKEFKGHLEVPLGDMVARKELEKKDPDLNLVRQGFIKGRIHPEDVDGTIRLIQRFGNVSYVKKAIEIWIQGDEMTQELIVAAENLHQKINSDATQNQITASLEEIDKIDEKLTIIEMQFAQTLGEGSRQVEGLMLFTLLLMAVVVQTTGLLLTVAFSRNLSKGLKELNEAAKRVGRGVFTTKVPVRSEDELGELAESLNKMTDDLRNNVGQRHQAETANRIKSLFLANMSHEIRTPLSAIIGFADLLRDPELTQNEREQYLAIIRRTGENLTRLINEILDLSKVEAGHLEIEKSTFALSPFLHEIQLLMIKKAQDKPIHIEFTRRGNTPEYIFTDPDRLRQILTNILGNAIKFTEKGSVSMIYEVSGQNLIFRITDTGSGIQTDKKHLLFKPFSQIDNSTSRRHEGTGLGLVLSHKLAQILGGSVTLENSTEGKGSEFKIQIPFENAKKTTLSFVESPQTPRSLSSTSILLVDDVEDNRLLVHRILSRKGAQVTLASNGAEGVAKALAGNFDLVLMDIQMPEMDGYTATQKLREAGYSKPIVALTAHAMKEDRERCLQAGCTDYLTKPIHVDNLIAIISSLAEQDH